MAALDQVVTDDTVLGKTSAQRLLEGLSVVDALADERTLAEHVLVDVRHRTCVRVDARLAPVQSKDANSIPATAHTTFFAVLFVFPVLTPL